jgi:hypothetical protein
MYMFSFPAPLFMSTMLSQFPISPVKRIAATIVRPPFVAMFKVRGPASRYCICSRSKVTWPLPSGPPSVLYVGMEVDPWEYEFCNDQNLGGLVRARNRVREQYERESSYFASEFWGHGSHFELFLWKPILQLHTLPPVWIFE